MDDILFLDLIVFALRGDTPSVQYRDLLVGIEVNPDVSVLTALGTKNLVGLPHHSFDLVGADDGYICFGVQQHGGGLLVMRRQWHVDQRMHPARRVACGERLGKDGKDRQQA